MAIMATSEDEGTAVLDVIAGLKKPIIGDVILNGQNVKDWALKNRVAYVQNDAHLCKDMTALQMLRYHYDLKKPTEKLGHLKIYAMDRVMREFENFLILIILFADKRSNRGSRLGASA